MARTAGQTNPHADQMTRTPSWLTYDERNSRLNHADTFARMIKVQHPGVRDHARRRKQSSMAGVMATAA